MLNPLHMNWPRQPGPIHMYWSMHPKLTLATHAFLLLRRTSVTLHGAISRYGMHRAGVLGVEMLCL